MSSGSLHPPHRPASLPSRAGHAIRTVTRGLRIVAGLVIASALLGAGPARAQDTPSLAGYTGTASSSGIYVTYAPQGLLPIASPVDFGAPDALATVNTGPATFARASVLDPGDLLANPDALLALFSAAYPAGTLPPYPYRIVASSGAGQPNAESAPAPGLNARVEADSSRSSAVATMAGTATPGIATFGALRSDATAKIEDDTVTVHARTEVGDINVLGIVTIKSVVTDLVASSTDGETKVSGGTEVLGAMVAGQPVRIDSEGIRSAATGLDLAGLLAPLGIKITLAGPVSFEGGGPVGQLASAGLRIDVALSTTNLPGLDELLGSLPAIEPIAPGAPSIDDVLTLARTRHLASIEFARGIVTLNTRSAASRSAGIPLTPSSPSFVPSSPQLEFGLDGLPRPSTSSGAAVTGSPAMAGSLDPGLAGIAVLLLLLQPLAADVLARLAVAQLATDQGECPWEDP